MQSTAAQALGPLLRYLPYQTFNKVQEAVIPSLFTNDANCLIAAPTGSGKTVLLEVTMLRLFRKRLLTNSNGVAATQSAVACPDDATCAEPLSRARKHKAVYICPIKALANEKYEHWRKQFPSLAVVIETGDQMQQRENPHRANTDDSLGGSACAGVNNTRTPGAAAEDMTSVSQADILVTTPERWDSITRRWKEKEVMAIVNSVGLLLLDEVHTVQEERGAAMEAIVSRVKAIQAATAHDLVAHGAATRIVAISGTLPNVRDMAEWLGVPPGMTFAFSAADRPVPLTVKVISYAHDSANPFAFHRFLTFKLFGLVQQYSEGKPTLVFCASRKEVTSTAVQLVEDIRGAATRRGQLAQLQPSDDIRQLSQQASDKLLRNCLLTGVGFHHAAMTSGDRLLVERMFREQFIAVVCSTTTLALGVNLPAHLVIIKGTTFFSSGQCQDVSVSEVMQMCGRAGRPGLDTHGVALVLTTQRAAPLYDSLRSGNVAMTCVESHLHRHMIEHVNAEVALRTIQSFRTATEWAKTTFFWIRLRQCPRHYGLTFASKAEEDEFSAQTFVEALMERVLRVLVEEGCITMSQTSTAVALSTTASDTPLSPPHVHVVPPSEQSDATSIDSALDEIRQPGVVFEPTRLGRAMSRMYILFDTVCVLNAELKKRGVATQPSLRLLSENGLSDVADMVGDDDGDGTGEGAGAPTRTTGEEEADAGAAAGCDDVACEESVTPHAATSSNACTPFTLQDTLQLLCQCQELVEVRLRQGDRGPLNEINRAVRFPLHSGRRGGREVREDWHKAYLLIQAHVGLLPLTEVSLRNDATRLWSVVPRVSRFLEEYAWAQSTSFSFACRANLLARCMERRVWPDGPVLRQLPHVSDAVAKALLRGGYRGFASLRGVDARQLEVLCSRLPPFGSQVLSSVRSLPQLEVELVLRSPDNARGSSQVCAETRKCEGLVRVFVVQNGTDTCDLRNPAIEASFDARILANAEPMKRQGGKAALTDTAVRDGRVLLIVGAPKNDIVLLKRFVPLSITTNTAAPPPSVQVLPGVNDSTRLTEEKRIGQKLEIASFTFHIPPAIRSSANAGSGNSGASCTIEACCCVLHMVGLDVTAQVSTAEMCVSGAAGCSTAITATSAGTAASGVRAETPTLEQFWSGKPSQKRTAGTTVDATAAHADDAHTAKESVATGAAEVVQTDASKQIAAEAREGFAALLADLAYVESGDTSARRQQRKERKRPRDDAAHDTTPGLAPAPQRATDVKQGTVDASKPALPEAATEVTTAAAAAENPAATKSEFVTSPMKKVFEMGNGGSPLRSSRTPRVESPALPQRRTTFLTTDTPAGKATTGAATQLCDTPVQYSDQRQQQRQERFSSPASAGRVSTFGVSTTPAAADISGYSENSGAKAPVTLVRLPRCASPAATRPSPSGPQRQTANVSALQFDVNLGAPAGYPLSIAERDDARRRFYEETSSLPYSASSSFYQAGGPAGTTYGQRQLSVNAPPPSPQYFGQPVSMAQNYSNCYGHRAPEAATGMQASQVPYAASSGYASFQRPLPLEQRRSDYWWTPPTVGQPVYQPSPHSHMWAGSQVPPPVNWAQPTSHLYDLAENRQSANSPLGHLYPPYENGSYNEGQSVGQPFSYAAHDQRSLAAPPPAHSAWTGHSARPYYGAEHRLAAHTSPPLPFLQSEMRGDRVSSPVYGSNRVVSGGFELPPQQLPRLRSRITPNGHTPDRAPPTFRPTLTHPTDVSFRDRGGSVIVNAPPQQAARGESVAPQRTYQGTSTSFDGSSSSYTPHVRRSAMVSHSWWQ